MPKITLEEGALQVDGTDVFLAGLVYHPVPICEDADYDFTADEHIRERDLSRLSGLTKGAPRHRVVLRLVRPATQEFLDLAHDHNILVIPGIHISHRLDFTDAKVCKDIEQRFTDLVEGSKMHPAIVAYELGSEVGLLLSLSHLLDKEERIRAWYRCINKVAAVAEEIEGIHHRPVGTVSIASDDDPIGREDMGADDVSLSNLDLHMISIYRGSTVREWLRGPQRALSSKPIFFSGFGADVCLLEGGACTVDEDTQARYVVSLARDLGASWFEITQPQYRAIGGAGFEYSDEWWKGNDTPCEQDTGGYFEDAYPDASMNEEWLGLVSLTDDGGVKERKAFTQLTQVWSGAAPWPKGGTPTITIKSHEGGEEVGYVGYFWGTFSGFNGEETLALLIEPLDEPGTFYPQHPLSLHYGSGPTDWTMLTYFGAPGAKPAGKRYRVVPAYLGRNPHHYQAFVDKIESGAPFYGAPDWLTVLPKAAVTVVY